MLLQKSSYPETHIIYDLKGSGGEQLMSNKEKKKPKEKPAPKK